MSSEKQRKAAHDAEAAASEKEEIISSHAVNHLAQSLKVADIRPSASLSSEYFKSLCEMVLDNRARIIKLEPVTLWQKICAVLNHKIW